MRESASVVLFKTCLLRERFYIPPVNKLVYLGDRYLSGLHTRLRLNNCGLNYYLFLMNCVPSSPCCTCGALREDVTQSLYIYYFALALLLCVASMLVSVTRLVENVWIVSRNKWTCYYMDQEFKL